MRCSISVYSMYMPHMNAYNLHCRRVLVGVTRLSEEDSETKQSKKIRDTLEQIVHELEQGASPSEGWGAKTESNRERWSRLKEQIQTRQRELKSLVMQKRSGEISPEEFDRRYRILQDELTELEAEVYNLRLGTHVTI